MKRFDGGRVGVVGGLAASATVFGFLLLSVGPRPERPIETPQVTVDTAAGGRGYSFNWRRRGEPRVMFFEAGRWERARIRRSGTYVFIHVPRRPARGPREIVIEGDRFPAPPLW